MELRGEKPRKPEKESIHMKKATVFNKVLSVLLVVSLVLSLAIPGLAAQTDVSFKQVSNSSVSAKLPGREAADVAEDEAPYADTEIVRVSIVLEKAGTLEAGYAVETVGTNFFA
jgi:competence protein ComGC